MGEAFYFHVTLEPHKKRSGSKTGRRILFLVEVPIDAAKNGQRILRTKELLRQEAERLSRELAPIAMTGELRHGGEDVMEISSVRSSSHRMISSNVPRMLKRMVCAFGITRSECRMSLAASLRVWRGTRSCAILIILGPC